MFMFTTQSAVAGLLSNGDGRLQLFCCELTHKLRYTERFCPFALHLDI